MRPYSHADYEELSSWYTARNMEVPQSDSLPALGCFMPEVAAGFLYVTDSTMCLLEGYISNPKSAKEERDMALDEITEALLAAANELGFKHVLVLTNHPAIEERARYWGFSSKGVHKLMYRELD